MSMGGSNYRAPPSAEAVEAQRLERTRPRMPHFATEREREIWRASLPRGDRIICEVVCQPNAHGLAKGRKPYYAMRVVDRKIWAKLDNNQRGQWIERIRAEVGA
jgi:hypothetical protein